MAGCLKNLVGKGTVLVLLVAAAYAGWRWGPEIFPRIQEWMERSGGGAGPELFPALSWRTRCWRGSRGSGGERGRPSWPSEEVRSLRCFGIPGRV